MKIEKTEFFIAKGRLFELLKRHYSIAAEIQVSFGRMFNTKKYQRKLRHVRVLNFRYHKKIAKIIKENNLDWCAWEVKMVGSVNLYDVMDGNRQKYRILRKP
jgi:hypothetical protein